MRYMIVCAGFADDLESAMIFARQPPVCRPIRDDGKPNRPLTAYHLAIQSVDLG